MAKQKKASPKAYKIKVSTNALKNIDEITGYIAFINQQPLNAIKVGDAILRTIEKISLNPYAFKECEEIPTKTKIYRRAVCQSWCVIYRIINYEILVLGIIHAARRPSQSKALRKIK